MEIRLGSLKTMNQKFHKQYNVLVKLSSLYVVEPMNHGQENKILFELSRQDSPPIIFSTRIFRFQC
jgi:hypothetical protein